MIKNGNAYMDDCPIDIIRKNRKQCIESLSMSNSVDHNLHLWELFVSGTDSNLVLRAKINMQDINACMRDPVLFRKCIKPHYLTGNKYFVYPSYDFSCPILDSIESITHTFRTIEYADRNDLYFWVLDKLSLRKPILQLFSSLRFDRTVLSKRKIRTLIQNNILENWDGPRLCTIKGLIRRGITPECIIKYVDTMYLSKNNTKQGTYQIMISTNAAILENITSRYTIINKKNIYTGTFDCMLKEKLIEVNLHPKYTEFGKKNMVISNIIYLEEIDIQTLVIGEEITLMNLGNVFVKFIDHSTKEIIFKPNFEGNFKLTKKKYIGYLLKIVVIL